LNEGAARERGSFAFDGASAGTPSDAENQVASGQRMKTRNGFKPSSPSPTIPTADIHVRFSNKKTARLQTQRAV